MKKLLQTTGLIFAMLLLANVGMAQTYTFSPANNATGVSTSPTLTITFDGPVTFGLFKNITVFSSDYVHFFQYSTGNGSFPSLNSHLSISGNILTINLSNDVLYDNMIYSIVIDAGAIKVGGVVWDDLNDPTYSNSIWSFTTAAAVEGPKIVSVTPANESTDISITPTLIVEFDRAIEIGTGGSFRLKSDAGDFGFSISNPNMSISGSTLTIIAAGLNYNTTYHVEIDPGFIQNFAVISDPSYWTFTTETAPPKWAENYPTITQSPTGFTFKGKTDLAGTYYYVVTIEDIQPDVDDIISGVNALESGNEIMKADTVFSKSINFIPNLPIGQTYYLYVLTRSSNGKNSIVKRLSIDRTVPSINDNLSNPKNGYELFKVDDDILIVFTKKVFDYIESQILPLSEASFSLTIGGASIPVDVFVSENGREVTLTPQEDLLEDTAYVVEIKSVSDAHHNVMNAVTRTFHTDKLNVWTGSLSNSWVDDGNWQGDFYVAGKSVWIQSEAAHFPTISSDITVNNFTIEAGAVVTQNSGIISVLGDFDLLSSVDKNASYLPKGGSLNVEGETRVHQYIVEGRGWINYLMGTPTQNATNTNIGTIYRVKYYDNHADDWFSINTNSMRPGIGYSVFAEKDLVFRGIINRDATTHELVRNNGKGYGWNVMGNPFTAGMKWGKLGIDTVTIENSYWIWNPQNKIYGAFNQEAGVGVGNLDGTIPSNHGFLVKLKIGETIGSITFDPKAMVANDNNYLKSASKSTPHMKISAGDGSFTDQLAIAFVSDAAQGIDKYDTEKFFGSGTLEVFSVEGTSKLSINSLPENNKETTVGLGYRATKAGTYTIELSDNYLDHYEVILTDSKGGKEIDLLYDGSYTFTVDKPETNNTRFTLTFPAMVSTSIEKGASKIDLKIYSQEGDIIAELVSGAKSMTYELVSVSGQVLKRGDLYSGVNNLGKQPSGLFIINTKNSEGTIISKKLLVTR